MGSAIGVVSLAAAGVLAVGTAPASAPPAAAAGLSRFGSCDALRDWYVAAAADQVGAYGWDGAGGGLMRSFAVPQAAEAAAGTTDAAVGSSATGTNVQEAGVDEPDAAKTDGTLLARVSGDAVVLDDVTGDQPRELSSYRLPGSMAGAQLLLVGHRLVVIGGATGRMVPMAAGGISDDVAQGIAPISSGARVLVIDVDDPTAPRVTSDRTYPDAEVTARQYDDVVRLVVTRDRPDLRFTYPTSDSETGLARGRNRAVVRATSWRDWVPTVRDAGGSARPLVSCDQVMRPATGSTLGSVTVVGFRPDHPDTTSATSVAASGTTVYSTPDAMYIASVDSSSGLLSRVASAIGRPVYRATTTVHELDLSGVDATYAASGEVAGSLKESWSMDARDDRLRLAVSTGSLLTTDDGAHRAGANAVVVMRREGNRLVESGRVGDLGPGEEIKSVRWFDHAAVVVTFRQLDPLYVVDLADPDHPRTTGELSMPGFSGYLHPIGHDRLLGLGVDADSRGRATGGLAQVFDLSDPAAPRLVDRTNLGADQWLEVSSDPHAFTWLPAASTGYAGAGQQLLRLHVDDAGRLTTSSTPLPGDDWAGTTRTLPLPGGRVAVVSDRGVVVQPA